MRLIISICFLTLLTNNLFAGNNICSLPVLLNKQIDRLDLRNRIYLYEDESRDKHFDEIYANDCWFMPVADPNLNFDFTTSAYWVKIVLENTGDEIQNYLFSVKAADINYLDFFEVVNQKHSRTHRTGQLLPVSSKQVKHRYFAFKLNLKPNSLHEYYLYMYNDGNSMVAPIVIQSHEDFLFEEGTENTRNAFGFGMLFFIFLLSFFLTFRLQSLMYLYYSMFVFFASMSLLCIQGYGTYMLNNFVWLADRTGPISALIADISLLLFVKLFLGASLFKGAINYIHKYLLYLCGSFIILMLLPTPYILWGYVSVSISTVLTFITVVSASFMLLPHQKLKSIYILLSFSPITVAVIAYFIKSLGYIQNLQLTNWLNLLFSVQVLMLAIALVDNFFRSHARINATLHEQNEKMRKLNVAVSQTDNGIAVYDADGYLEWNNTNFKNLHECKKTDSCENRHITELLFSTEKEQCFEHMKNDRNSLIFESQIDHPELGNRWIQTIMAPVIDKKGELVSVVSIESDISKLKENEDDKRKLHEQLVQAQKMETVGKLAGGIAHDFNNILTPIIGYTEIVIAELGDENPLKADLEIVMKASLRARKMVKQILTFSRHFKKDEKLVRVADSIHEAMLLLKTSVPPSITVDFQNNAPFSKVVADPTQLQQIFINLLTNSIHAIGRNEGNISIILDTVEKQNNQLIAENKKLHDQKYVCVTVADNGVGIDSVSMAKVFDPFYTTKEVGKGTGLGLSVVHGIVKSLKGEIILQSEVGAGTRAHVFFPMNTETAAVDTEKVQISYEGKNQHIMVVDDESSIVKLMKRMLERQGFEVTCLTSSLEAYKCFVADRYKYSLLITDQTMPEMTGDQLIKEVKKLSDAVKVIIMTGYSEIMDAEKARKLGIDSLIYKPVKKEELLTVIAQLLEENSS